MINLLPPEVKENFTYARRNSTLLKWLIGVGIGVVGIAMVVGGGWFFLHNSIISYDALVSDQTAQLKNQKLNDVQKQVTSISNNLKLVVKVLSREVLFSKLLTQIGAALPRGSVLTDLNITQVDGGLDLQAAATDYQTASQIQLNLQGANAKIFNKADIVSIQCQTSSGGVGFSSSYPCKVNVRAQFANDNQFLFIHNNTAAAKVTP